MTILPTYFLFYNYYADGAEPHIHAMDSPTIVAP